ncbi:hypothetical protein PIB30_036551, partial [Stylosanthes scabra]|nr:hypothetical protein [Stylosanthes scabra]
GWFNCAPPKIPSRVPYRVVLPFSSLFHHSGVIWQRMLQGGEKWKAQLALLMGPQIYGAYLIITKVALNDGVN